MDVAHDPIPNDVGHRRIVESAMPDFGDTCVVLTVDDLPQRPFGDSSLGTEQLSPELTRIDRSTALSMRIDLARH